MPAYIHHIATRTPCHAYGQACTRDRLKGWAGNPRTRRLIHAIYNRSGIETRHSVSGDFITDAEATLYRTAEDGALIPPGTGARNACYARESRKLAVAVARQALNDAPGFTARDVTHIVFASCTGFANPGPDYHIIRELGLRESVQRYTLGFMGCYAAFPALRMAAQFCGADAGAVVLVVCLELCTLHMQVNDEPDSILANSLFADGAAAAIVSARAPQPRAAAYRLQGFESALMASSEREMAWDIGDTGFNIVLSSYVPDIIGAGIHTLLGGVLRRQGVSIEQIHEWAVHPGGRAILDKVGQSLALKPDALDASRAVLRDYGNMSSATILFVLKELLDQAGSEPATTCALAFGPGLTVETAVLERLGCTAPPAQAREENRTEAGYEA
ncbi:MAG TPA: type III polyketide synthase [Verrucomicrobiales bacterium]|nr:type III polyketide synthase [Verrucomicrobiales bacterium]